MTLFDLAGLKGKKQVLAEKTEREDFWNDRENATKILREKKSIENKIDEYEAIETLVDDIETLIQMAEEEGDSSLASEIKSSYEDAVSKTEELKIKTLLDGTYDNHNAIISIHAGSGGTDAQDWASMLLRMYTRWCESKDYKVQLIYLQDDVDAGIKSATLRVEGEYAYGYLKNEKGVHRVVRISPFDSGSRRHTSFSSLDVMPEIDDDITVEIDPEDLRIDTYRSSGAGGQHVNKTDSAIRITHIPTNLVVTCQNERSQHQNRDMAMKILKSKLVELKEKEQKATLAELQGDYSQITWGSQIRSYVFHPYSLVKDHRTDAETGNVQAVMDGKLDYFIYEKLKQKELDNYGD